MFGHRSSGKGLFAGAVCACVSVGVFALSVFAASASKDDRSWKNYYNRQAGYCVDYPSRWVTGEALDGAAFFLKPTPNRTTSSLAEIDGAVLPASDSRSTLEEEAELHLAHLGKFEMAEQLHLAEQHETLLFGSPALFTRDEYYDPQNHAAMVEEIVLASHGGVVYRLELESRANELGRFEPVFRHLVSSFRFDCPAHALPRSFGSSGPRRDREASMAGPLAIYPHPVAR